MQSRKIEITVKQDTDKRLDAYLTEQLGQYTRSFIKNLFDGGNVTLNGSPAKAGHKPKQGDRIEVVLPEIRDAGIEAQDIPIEIVYEDEDIAVINKPQGMVTHPAAGNANGTLVNALLFHIKNLSGIGGELRPGIVHRLDKDTSGLIVVAKNDAAHAKLSEALQNREVRKEYIALCHGNLKADEGTVKTNIDRHPKDRKKMAVSHAGREAVTHYKVLQRYGKYTLLSVEIETGRTHQIRVHMKHIGHPVVGDAVYTKLKDPFPIKGQLLHASKLGFAHPRTDEEMEFSVPLPGYFENVVKKLSQAEDFY